MRCAAPAKRAGRRLGALFLLLLLAAAFTSCRKKRTRAPTPPPIAIPGEEIGVASWYGHPYHGRRTANGEVYDMDRMTAAHNTRRFDTWLRVHNLDTGKTVEVRINDRGPFVKNRIIDLSRAAARSIDMIGPGTAWVRLETITAPPVPAVPEASEEEVRGDASVESGSLDLYGVQVGAFGSIDNAERMSEELSGRFGLSRMVFHDGSPPVWRVVAGEFTELEGAEAFADTIRSEWPEAFVVRLDPFEEE